MKQLIKRWLGIDFLEITNERLRDRVSELEDDVRAEYRKNCSLQHEVDVLKRRLATGKYPQRRRRK